jgi:beta-glucosidase
MLSLIATSRTFAKQRLQRRRIVLAGGIALLALAATALRGGAQGTAIAQVPGVNAHCTVPAGEKPWMNTGQTPTCRALEALAAMTEDEKLAFRGSLPRLGLNNGGGSDGPSGIAGGGGRNGAPPPPRSLGVTLFPSEQILAATWDRSLAKRYGQALGEEVAGKGSNVMVSPTIVLMRGWHWGRAAESFGEDPYLTAEMLVPELQEIQGHKAISVLKHFVVDGQEMFRPRVSAVVSERALQEIYFPAWKAAVQRAGLGAVFCESNRVNGLNPCESPDLVGRLREWGFDGYIRPEPGFDPVRAIKAGTDEVQGPAFQAAIQSGAVPASKLDETVLHHLVPNFRLGIYDAPASGKPENAVSTPEHQRLAVEVGTAGTVLLKNKDHILPFDSRVKTIAVIGDDASANAMLQATNQPVFVEKFVSPLEGIARRAGTTVKINYARGTLGVIASLAAITPDMLKTAGGDSHGLRATFWSGEDWSGEPVGTRTDTTIDLTAAPLPQLQLPAPPAPPAGGPAAGRGAGGPGGGRGGGPRTAYSARWEGTLTPATTGLYRFAISGAGNAALWVNNETIATMKPGAPNPAHGVVRLTAGTPAPIKLDYTTRGGNNPTIRLGWQPPDPSMTAETTKAAKESDVAVVFVGERLGEGTDKQSLNLPGDQDELIATVAKINPRTVVVINTPTPIAMPWLDQVAAVVYAGYPGQSSGDIIAPIVFGDVNPSGKLVVTFPASPQQGPGAAAANYPGLDGQTVARDEGILVGYRYFDSRNQEPLFPFGFGLSYTTFRYGPLKLDAAQDRWTAHVDIANSGSRAGAEVVQLYLGYPAGANEPPRVLKGFEKISLKPGEGKSVSIPLDRDALSVWDDGSKQWTTFPGSYVVSVGSSSRDIRAKTTFTVPPR